MNSRLGMLSGVAHKNYSDIMAHAVRLATAIVDLDAELTWAMMVVSHERELGCALDRSGMGTVDDDAAILEPLLAAVVKVREARRKIAEREDRRHAKAAGL